MILGFILALIVSVLFAVYAVPRKYSRQNVILYTMWLGAAYFTGSAMMTAVMWGFGLSKAENLLSPWHFVTIARGFVWVLGTAAYNLAIDRIGLARFNQWKNIQGPVGSLLMLIFLTDMAGVKMLWLLLGMTAMFISAFIFQIKTDAGRDAKDSVFGVASAIFAGVCFGVTALLNKIVSDQGFLYAQLLYHSLSLTVFSFLIYLLIGNGTLTQKGEPFKERCKNVFIVDKKTWLPVMAGGMFIAATVLSILSYGLIPGPVSWTVTQFNAFWTILIGIFLFKEVDFKKHRLRLSAGFLAALCAVVFLFFAL